MAIDATIGGASSNSYLTVEDATALLEQRVGAGTDFQDADEADQEAALITASRRLDLEAYQSWRHTTTQALEFPRSNFRNSQTYQLYLYTVIPPPILQATAELALQLIRNPDLLDDTGLEGFSSLSKGDVSLTPRERTSGTLPAQVARFLRGIRVGGDGVARKVRG